MLTLAAWLHDWDPFAIRLTETLGVRWYGLSYVAGFVAAWAILKHLARRGLILLKPDEVADLIFAAVVGTLAGGRLGYCLVYRPSLLIDFRSDMPFWGVLALNEGGMASHGGMVGLALACIWFAWRRKHSPLHLMDCLSFVAPVGIFFGRIANFINGELLGSIVAMPGRPAPWWAVRFPQELIEGKHAPELTDAQAERLGDLLRGVAQPGDDEWTAAHRLIEKVQQGDAATAQALEPLLSARHASQIYQAIAEGIVVAAILALVWARPRKPGVVVAWFFMSYGVGRVLTEFIRLPDAHLTVPRIAGLSRGQWLSVAMVAVGVILLGWIARRSTKPVVGGWVSRGSSITHAGV